MERIKRFLKENWLFIVAIIYFLVPTDIIPDFIPVVGKADDSLLFLFEIIKRYKEFKRNEKA